MAKKSHVTSAPVEAQVTADTPVVTQEQPVTAEAKKGKRYAPISVLANPNAVIASIAPNPKRPGSLAFDKYAMFQVGQTIAQVEAAFENSTTLPLQSRKRVKARNELRWDYEHGFITLEVPQAGE